ncbi:site-specific integrase [Neiella marina]|uniref:Site-specific integrase n=1 Tax=Neiella holothuriorum TaxID=2870530 RepID=A0ABS7EKQ7_9GAMM|nr:tyrosine-type recombinase/integrase [Neiella holothuriorum]MBW8192942.1 site-specific integrase [Neiella holothuriorum]
MELVLTDSVGHIDVFDPAQGESPSDEYLRTLESKLSFDNMTIYLNAVAKLLGRSHHRNCPWHQITAKHVKQIKQYFLDENKAPATINLYLSAIKGVMKQAWELDLVDANTYLRIKSIRSAKGTRISRSRVISNEEYIKVSQSLEQLNDYKSIRDRAIFDALYYCGFRRSEIANIELSNINMDTKEIYVIGKGNKERKAFINDKLSASLSAWLATRGLEDGPLFLRTNRNRQPLYYSDELGQKYQPPITRSSIKGILETLATSAGVELFKPHDVRHTFATRLLSADVDIFTVQKLMGHADISTTRRYDKRDEQSMRVAISLL